MTKTEYMAARERVTRWMELGCPPVTGDTLAREKFKSDLATLLAGPPVSREDVARVIEDLVLSAFFDHPYKKVPPNMRIAAGMVSDDAADAIQALYRGGRP